MGVAAPARGQQVVDFIRWFLRTHSYAPSVREMADGIGVSSTSTVWFILRDLKQKGRVTWVPNSPRTFKVIDDGS